MKKKYTDTIFYALFTHNYTPDNMHYSNKTIKRLYDKINIMRSYKIYNYINNLSNNLQKEFLLDLVNDNNEFYVNRETITTRNNDRYGFYHIHTTYLIIPYIGRELLSSNKVYEN